MPDAGSFDAKIKLELTSCDCIPPFADTLEIKGLTSTLKEVLTLELSGKSNKPVELEGCPEGHAEVSTIGCVEISNGSAEPKLLILRPSQVQTTLNGQSPIWEDIDKSGVSRDCLEDHLTATVNGNPIRFGRTLFLTDGLITLLINKGNASSGKTGSSDCKQALLVCKLTEGLSIDVPGPDSTKTKKKDVTGVRVQVVAAYARKEKCPKPEDKCED